MRTLSLLAALLLCAFGCRALAPPLRWNAQIAWAPTFEDALVRAKAERKPVMLSFYADWCPPCKDEVRYVFSDPRIVERSRDIVMVHVNTDQREDLNGRYQLGGPTLPRTYFFMPDGTLLKGVRAGLVRRYGYDHKDPAALLAAMEKALAFARDPYVAPGTDPSAATEAQVCGASASEDACKTCRRAQCCAEILRFVNFAATQPLVDCLAMHCSDTCPKEGPP